MLDLMADILNQWTLRAVTGDDGDPGVSALEQVFPAVEPEAAFGAFRAVAAEA